MATCPWTHVTALLCSLLCFACVSVLAVRKENRCMKHYMVETIKHPFKHCRNKEILLTKCEGYCNKSRTLPRISFSPVLFRPFKRHCSCCRDRLSIMKAVALQCEGGEVVYATYRYILRCGCRYCHHR